MKAIIIMGSCILTIASCRSAAPLLPATSAGTVGIGVLLHTTGPRLGPEVRPEVATLMPRQRAEWFSVDGELRIDPREQLPAAECQKRRQGHLCWMQIPENQPAGRYRYRAFIRLEDGTEYPVDALLDIRR